MSGKLKIKINHGIAGYNSGDTVEVDTKEDGSPADRFWRRRLRDSERDDCCEVVQPKSKSQAKRVAVQRPATTEGSE